MIVHCAFCNAELERQLSKVNSNKSGLWFCNQEERAAYYRETGRARGAPQQRGWRREFKATIRGGRADA